MLKSKKKTEEKQEITLEEFLETEVVTFIAIADKARGTSSAPA